MQADATLAARGARAGRAARAAAGARALGRCGRAPRAHRSAEFDARTRARLRGPREHCAPRCPPTRVVFSDMTQIAYLGNYAFAAERPGVWFHPSGYGTLGYALPAAIGAKIAQPQSAPSSHSPAISACSSRCRS